MIDVKRCSVRVTGEGCLADSVVGDEEDLKKVRNAERSEED